MADRYATAQDAEDAFYDAIDENDLTAMMSVWEDSQDIACLLPMQPLVQGRGPVENTWGPLFASEVNVSIQVHHIRWVEAGDLAFHYVQEIARVSNQPGPQAPVYATNVFRRGPDGWHLILHQNSPTPSPPDMLRGMGPGGMPPRPV